MPYLEYYPPRGEATRPIPIVSLPFRMGRSSACHCLVASHEVSKEHAEIVGVGDGYHLCDLDSTNGTFINGCRIVEAPLSDGDSFHLAHEEFRFRANSEQGFVDAIPNTVPVAGFAPVSIDQGRHHLREMIDNEWVRVLFQPIVDLESHEPVGYEVTLRGLHNDLSVLPAELLRLAARGQMAEEVSRFFRQLALRASSEIPRDKDLFLRLLPGEPSGLSHALEELRSADRPLVLEFGEKVACDWPTLQRAHQLVKNSGLKVAYGGFGAERTHFFELSEVLPEELPPLRQLHEQMKTQGVLIASRDFRVAHARFFELAEMRPEFVKLEAGLSKQTARTDAHSNRIKSLAVASHELGIKVIADGVETEEEADACRHLGCQFGQGFLFGLPKPLAELQPKRARTSFLNVAALRTALRTQAADPFPPTGE